MGMKLRTDAASRRLRSGGGYLVLQVKGLRVSPGYYRNPAATAEAFDEQGYFNTGDTGVFLSTGELVVTGRSKDVIVLMNGENVAPAPVEVLPLHLLRKGSVSIVGDQHTGSGIGARCS